MNYKRKFLCREEWLKRRTERALEELREALNGSWKYRYD